MQTNLKRMLAYSSVGQVGYMLVGLAVGTQAGLTGTFLQFFNHALMKGAAFLCAGAIIYRLGACDLSDMVGIGRKMPLTAVIFTISVFALIGMPPFNGFISEVTLFTSTFQVDLAWLGITLILNSAISAGYYLRIIRTLIQPISSEKVAQAKEAPWLMLVPLIGLAVLIVLFGVWPDQLVKFAEQAAGALLSFGGSM
jgi:multicomponent Na+:H+ antiporter subunit D